MPLDCESAELRVRYRSGSGEDTARIALCWGRSMIRDELNPLTAW